MGTGKVEVEVGSFNMWYTGMRDIYDTKIFPTKSRTGDMKNLSALQDREIKGNRWIENK
jgi:hypothetical protein